MCLLTVSGIGGSVTPYLLHSRALACASSGSGTGDRLQFRVDEPDQLFDGRPSDGQAGFELWITEARAVRARI